MDAQKQKIKTKFGITLYSKYTGEQVTILGSTFNSREEALEWAEEGVCSRCHRIEINYVPEDFIWKNKKEGFVKNAIQTN